MKITVVGLGYIGLPTASLLASRGHDVVGIDKSEFVVSMVNKGESHIVESGLGDLIRKSVEEKKLFASLVPQKSDVFVIAVPTPFEDHKKPDLSYVREAALSIAPFLEKGNLVILESTIPVGTTEKFTDWLSQSNEELSFPDYNKNSEDHDVYIAHCPERVLPGNILHELIHNDRTIGGITEKCSSVAKEFYKSFSEGNCHITSSRTAELSKLVENSFRDVNIAFANELSVISHDLVVDVWELIDIANSHPRVNILQPGPGVGGHCIAVDPWFIVDSAPKNAQLIKSARIVNDNQPFFVLKKIEKLLKSKNTNQFKIASLGLSFKPNVDDLRESPALQIAASVNDMGFAEHLVVEPNINKLPEELSGNKTKLVDLDLAIGSADIILLLVDHDQFREISHRNFDGKEIIDTRGLFRKNN